MLTGEALKAARERIGETQATFGQRFGVDQSTIHRWENQGPPLRGPGRMAVELVLADIAQLAPSASATAAPVPA